MPKDTLTLGKDLELPLDIVSRRTAVIGQTDTGKTSTAVVIVEEAASAGAQFVVLDPTGAWWGLTSNAAGDGPGVDCVVLGGRHGDIPLDEHAGHEVARLVADEGYSLVLDLDGLRSWAARQRFVADFCSELYERAHSQVLVVMDEAHRLAPQGRLDDTGHAARCLGAVSDVVLLGRRRGLATLMVCQRPAKLHKDVLEMSEVLIAHRVRGNNDRKALQGWVEEADLDVRALMAEIATLAKGVARVSAPTLGINETHTIRPKRTFDSSKSIGVGEVAMEPKARAHVDMDALRERMAATIEKAKADDPAALRKQIAELEQKLADGGEVSDEDKAEIADSAYQKGRADAGVEIERLRGELRRTEPVLVAADRLRAAYDALLEGRDVGRLEDWKAPESTGSTPRAHVSPPALVVEAPAPVTNGNGGPPIKAGARRMLDVLARYGPLPRRDLAVLSRVSPVSGTVSDYLSVLRQHALVAESDGQVEATTAGVELVHPGGEIPRRFTPEEVYGLWSGDLKAGARRMTEHLMRVYPDGFTRRELAGLAGISPQSGTVSDYMSVLRRRGLVVERNRRVYAGEVLYLGSGG